MFSEAIDKTVLSCPTLLMSKIQRAKENIGNKGVRIKLELTFMKSSIPFGKTLAIQGLSVVVPYMPIRLQEDNCRVNKRQQNISAGLL